MSDVKKREGGVERWSRDKLINSIAKSGVEIKESERIALKIEDWVNKNYNENPVDSLSIRQKVIEFMNKKFPLEVENYETYSKS